MPFNATGTTAERALLVSVVLGTPRRGPTRGAAQARDAASSTPGLTPAIRSDEDSRFA